MKRLVLTTLILLVAVLHAAAAFNLTASRVTIEDMTVDKPNYFVTVAAATSTGEYEVAFDIWPGKQSPVGSFTAADKTISYVSSYVHKTRANGSAVNMWYYPEPDATISLTITNNGNGTCTLSGSIDATRNEVTYTYVIAPYDFEYDAEDIPEPQEDPYRFEPKEATVIPFSADVVNFRQREGYIEITLNEMANETYDWIELRLLSDTMAWQAGTYAIDGSGIAGSLTASKGYLGGTRGDDPCYLAIRADKENWGQYTPYYLQSGTVEVSYNTVGDTIIVSGTALSYNGSTVQFTARSYNMLFVPEEQPRQPEFVNLAIDTVLITYQSDLSDSTKGEFYYTFNFFSRGGDYPNVLVDMILDQPMALTAGTYTLADNELKGLNLFQTQEDFNAVFFGGEPYVFATAALTLSEVQDGKWQYAMLITDTIGSEYTFDFAQDPHIVHYPIPVDPTEEQDKPYIDEQKTAVTVSVTLDSLLWNAKSVSKDGILDIYLTQQKADVNGLRAYLHLGMYTDSEYPEAGSYAVNGSEENGTFSASLGRFGNVLIPCYLLLIDAEGWAHAVWYIVDGTIRIAYDAQQAPVLSGTCTTYFGSTIHFTYGDINNGVEDVVVESQKSKVESRKVVRDGQLLIIRDGRTYNAQGLQVK